jgi:LCP family protein required for cell wall assembly
MAHGHSRRRRRRRRPPSLPRALGLTAASALVPGTGHLVARRHVAGWLLLGSFALLLSSVAALMLWVPRSRLLQLAVQPQTLRYAMGVGIVLGVTWVLVVLSSYAVTRPRGMSLLHRAIGGLVVIVLCVASAAPFAFGVRTAYVQHDLITHVFSANRQVAPDGGSMGDVAPDRPFIDKPRVNVLLLGGDAAKGRDGVRTDSMILASVDTSTGNTVLISLPRNLQRVRFEPGTPMAERFPFGFTDLLNAVYRYGEENRDVVPGARYAGAELIKQAFAHTLDLEVDYFVLVNLAGFRSIVDALGGVHINVERRIPVGGHTNENGYVVVPPNRYIEPGPQRLNGEDALWYGRSRIGSDDYERMARQRCLLGAIAKQADPLRVLTRFQQLVSATKRIVLTDIPQQALPQLVQLAMKGKSAKITSLPFVRSAKFRPSDPDYDYIRDRVRLALTESEKPLASPSPGSGAGSGSTTATSAPRSSAAPAPKPADSAGLVSLDEVCSYS